MNPELVIRSDDNGAEGRIIGSENNRRAKFYSITKLGLSQLGLEASNWAHFSDAVGKILDSGAQ